MNRRTERIGKLLQHAIGQVLLERLSDPRINSACTSITRVQVQEDLLFAKVYVSIIGTEAQQKRGIEALERAARRIALLVRRMVTLRHMPRLKFLPDLEFKEALETLDVIRQAMDEIRAAEPRQDDSQEGVAQEDGLQEGDSQKDDSQENENE